jgi:primosomal protein N' (replication factor Y)
MLAKGLDNPNVTLVGVINADSSFNLPDFRSCERGFQLLTQVAGRAGRGESPGVVYFQTYNPDFFALEDAKKQDYKNFYKTEIQAREEFDYPPFSRIIRLILSSDNQFRAEKSAMEIAMRLRETVSRKNWTEPLAVLGSAPCVIEKLQGSYRFQILIKNKLGERGHSFITSFLTQIKLPPDIKITVDVDPADIL